MSMIFMHAYVNASLEYVWVQSKSRPQAVSRLNAADNVLVLVLGLPAHLIIIVHHLQDVLLRDSNCCREKAVLIHEAAVALLASPRRMHGRSPV
jgi:hypothetical protein